VRATAHHTVLFYITKPKLRAVYLRQVPAVYTGQVPCDDAEACGTALEDSGGWKEPYLLQLPSPGFWECSLTHFILQVMYKCCRQALAETHPA